MAEGQGIIPNHPRYAFRHRLRNHEVQSGEATLAVLAIQWPDLILMDIQLPIMDGYEATRRIKADPALRSIPIIAVTSSALSGEEKKARAAGCNEYVPELYCPHSLRE